jgi:hypothetical protein
MQTFYLQITKLSLISDWALVYDNLNLKNVAIGDKVINHNCLFKHSYARTIDNFLWNVGN